jgi:hypothetical protein
MLHRPGLPDGIHILIPKIPIWFILKGQELENVGIFYGHSAYLMAILWSYGIYIYISPPVWYVLPKNLATLAATTLRRVPEQMSAIVYEVKSSCFFSPLI